MEKNAPDGLNIHCMDEAERPRLIREKYGVCLAEPSAQAEVTADVLRRRHRRPMPEGELAAQPLAESEQPAGQQVSSISAAQQPVTVRRRRRQQVILPNLNEPAETESVESVEIPVT